MTRVVLAAMAALAMAGCDDSPASPSDIVGQTWQLVSLQRDGSDLIFAPDPTKFTLRLEDGGRSAVMADCNTCGGSYSIDGSALEFSAIACTKIACPNGGPFDSDYALALEGAKTATLEDSELTIRGNGVTLRFKR